MNVRVTNVDHIINWYSDEYDDASWFWYSKSSATDPDGPNQLQDDQENAEDRYQTEVDVWCHDYQDEKRSSKTYYDSFESVVNHRTSCCQPGKFFMCTEKAFVDTFWSFFIKVIDHSF